MFAAPFLNAGDISAQVTMMSKTIVEKLAAVFHRPQGVDALSELGNDDTELNGAQQD
jgi:hypothetical protein